MMGYYRASWEHEGKTKYYSLTQFEVTFAFTYRVRVGISDVVCASPRLLGGRFHAGMSLPSKLHLP
jgi:hypothetical protein